VALLPRRNSLFDDRATRLEAFSDAQSDLRVPASAEREQLDAEFARRAD
jgi:hypothetical protein